LFFIGNINPLLFGTEITDTPKTITPSYKNKMLNKIKRWFRKKDEPINKKAEQTMMRINYETLDDLMFQRKYIKGFGLERCQDVIEKLLLKHRAKLIEDKVRALR